MAEQTAGHKRPASQTDDDNVHSVENHHGQKPDSTVRDAVQIPAKKKRKVFNVSTPSIPADSNGMLVEMPLDILFEIFVELQPQDLLALSRTTKGFRRLLINKSSIRFWKATFENVEFTLPPCFPGMNELQFVNLLYSSHCYNCSDGDVNTTVYWGFRARYCDRCKHTALRRIEKWDSLFAIGAGNHHGSASDFITKSSCGNTYTYLHCQEVEAFKEKWKCITDMFDRKWDCIRKEHRNYMEENDRITNECMAWLERMEIARLKMLNELREKRMSSILEKVRRLGYDAEVDRCLDATRRSLTNEQLAQEPELLSEDDWNTLEPRVVKIMEDIREKRLADEYKAALHARMQPLEKLLLTLRRKHGDTSFPTSMDFLNIPRIRKLVDLPAEAPFVIQDFEDAIKPMIPEIMSEWKTPMTKQLLQSINAKFNVLQDVDPFTLAVGQFFKCKRCRSSVFAYPNIYAHSCEIMRFDDHLDTYNSVFCKNFESSSMRSTVDQFESLADMVRDIVLLTGLSPKTATPSDMDTLAAQMVCQSCEDSVPGVMYVMDWRAMVVHVSWYHKYCVPSVRLAGDEELKFVSTLEEAKSYHDRWHALFLCRYCDDSVHQLTLLEILQHLKEKHEIDSVASIDEHTIRSSNDSPLIKEPQKLLSHEMCKIEGSEPWRLFKLGEGVACNFGELRSTKRV
ncbi:hypothetical protein ABKN59_011785 [Abortiporus biennis]